MKVFISHQQLDSDKAMLIARTLEKHGVSYYLDTIDKSFRKDGNDLADYIRIQLSRCNALIAVVSSATKKSWWVPWEIGVATERNYPLSTYLSAGTSPPEYLKKWPILRNLDDIGEFASLSKDISRRVRRMMDLNEVSSPLTAHRKAVAEFHKQLKKNIGQ